MNVYSQIEARYGFSIPDDYRQLEAKGWFNWNTKNPDYLWMNDGEWLTPDQILHYKFQDFQKEGFVPFAFTGGGDLWCWYPRWKENGISPVVFCPRDCYDATGYAPSFLGWMFRTIVEFSSSGLRLTDPVEAKNHFSRWRKDVSPLLPSQWTAVVSDLDQMLMRTGRDERDLRRAGFLSIGETKEIVQKHLAFPHLDENIRWMVPIEKTFISNG